MSMEMGAKTRVVIVLTVVGGLLIPLPGRSQGNSSPDNTMRLRLRSVDFDPLRENPAQAARNLPDSLHSLPPSDDLVLVQFAGAPRPEWLRQLRDDGAAIFDYVPENAYLARVDPQLSMKVRSRSYVRAIVPYLPAFRVAPELLAGGSTSRGERLRLLVQSTPDRTPARLAEAVASAAPHSAGIDEGSHPAASLVEIELDRGDLAALLPRLASLPDLLWIEERRPLVPNNNAMKWVLQTGIKGQTRLFSRGLTGVGQILGQCDSGLDFAHCFFTDPGQSVTTELINPSSPPAVPVTNPAHRKVLAYQYHSGSDTVDSVGHGTHVAGTAVGDDLAHPASGTNPGLDLNDGMAPAARLVFQDIDANGGFLEVPASLYGYLQAAYNAGARIHTNSWGADTNTYTSDSSQVDSFSWDHPDMLILFSAGNNGPNAATLGAPGSAKDVITVGMVDSPSGGDPNNLDSLSSNGPTSDGRRKPDVVNVGSPVLSAQSGTSCGTVAFTGTSMATPGVAGGAALVRQYFTEGFYPHGYAGSGPPLVPSGALLKAVVVNSSINISGTNVDAPIPDNSQGWGRVRLDDALFFPGDLERLLVLRDNDLASPTDGFPVGSTATESYPVFNCRTDVPLKVTLVWTDPPVAATSGQAWVNNLDLEVTVPGGGTTYKGNVFANGVSVAGGTADDRNNVEQVLIPAGAVASGTYTINVVARTVAVGPQPYALIVTGDVSTAAIPRFTATLLSRGGGCDGDAFLDEGETIDVAYTLHNEGCGAAGPLQATLTSTTGLPVTIQPASVGFPGLAPGGSTTANFTVALGDAAGVCAGELPLLLTVQTADGNRGELSDLQLLRFDPASGSRNASDNVETGDHSVSKDAPWQINTCMASSPTHAWHMGDVDCSGIPKDTLAYSLVLETSLVAGENLTSASFSHAFDGYSNASLNDSVHFEIDHDLDGNYDTIASWNDPTAPTTMTPAGPFDLSAYNSGRAATVRFRFRFKSGANWVGGPNNAAGWNVDNFTVNITTFAVCDTNSQQPPGNVGSTLSVISSGSDVQLSWGPVIGAAGYRVLRSESPTLTPADIFDTASPNFTNAGAIPDPRTFYYRVFARSACGVLSAN